MTDHFDIDGKVDDRIIALSRVLCDPNLGRDVKIAEIQSVCRRIDTLEGQRETAMSLSVIADALAARPGGTCTSADCDHPATGEAFIDEAEPPAWHPYCTECLEPLWNTGSRVRRIPIAEADHAR